MPETYELKAAPRVTHPETKAPTTIAVVETVKDFTAFQRVPSFVYWADPFYIAPIRSEERALLDRAQNPFFGHGEARLLTAWHGHGQPVGRIAAFIDRDHDARTGRRSGFFGFFEFMNDARVPEALLAETCTWLRARGATEIFGPVHFTTSHPTLRGLQLDGFYDDPVYGNTYNAPSYPGFIVRLGLEKAFDEIGYELDTTAPPPEALAAKARAVAERDGLRVRPLDLARFPAEWEAIRTIRDEANRATPRYVPPSKADFDREIPALIELIRIVPDGALILEEHGKAVGYAIALVDWNRVLKHLGGSKFPLGWLRALLLKRTIDRVRITDVAVTGEARGRVLPLVHALWSNLTARGYKRAHIGPIAEDNARATALAAKLGATRTHAWRVFKVPDAFPGAPSERTPSRGTG